MKKLLSMLITLSTTGLCAQIMDQPERMRQTLTTRIAPAIMTRPFPILQVTGERDLQARLSHLNVRDIVVLFRTLVAQTQFIDELNTQIGQLQTPGTGQPLSPEALTQARTHAQAIVDESVRTIRNILPNFALGQTAESVLETLAVSGQPALPVR